MKKLALILLGLVLMSASAIAYETVVTLTITNITDTGTPTNTIELDNYGHVVVDCKLGGSDIYSTRIDTVNVNDSYSFLCDLTSGTSYHFLIGMGVSYSSPQREYTVDNYPDLWTFPFVAD